MLDKLKTPGLLFIFGLLVVGALPPFYLIVLGFIGLSGFFLFLETAQSKKQAFFFGWFFGTGFFGGGLYWLGNAFLVDGDKHGWLLPIAIPLLAIGMGLFGGLTGVLAKIFYRGHTHDNARLGRLLLFACAWVMVEWMRSWIFTGFPWNMMASIWGLSDAFLQPAALIGSFGLSLLTVFVATLPALMWRAPRSSQLKTAAVMAGILLVWGGFGQARLMSAQTEMIEGVTLRLVQPNIKQSEKWKSEYKIRNFNRHLEMSLAPPKGDHPPTHIIWGETAATFPLNRHGEARKAIASVVPEGGLVITGTPAMTAQGQSPFQVWNSLVAIDDQANLVGRYDKSHLVPFGEYVPFRSLLPITKLTAGLVDFSSGEGLTDLDLKGLPTFSPLICYEVIFPHHVVSQTGEAKWLLNLTNDGWYGDTPGPYQHLMSARLRSIEQGLPLVRVANSGISAVSDAYGRILVSLPYGVADYADISLPKALDEATLTARFHALPWGFLTLGFFIFGQIKLIRPS